MEQVRAATARFEADLGPRWRRPVAWGVLREDPADGLVVDRANVGSGPPPAAVLACVLGHSGGTASIQFSAARLEQAIELLSPAEACRELDHPNLAAWRYLRLEIGDHGSAVAVFPDAIDILNPQDPHLDVLLRAVHHGRQEHPDGTTTLWRPVGPAELALLRAAGMRAWPPRLADQPFFYPVLNEGYARQIAQEWNVTASGAGYVTRFALPTAFARRYPTRQAGGREKFELCIPAEDLDELNRHLIGAIDLVELA